MKYGLSFKGKFSALFVGLVDIYEVVYLGKDLLHEAMTDLLKWYGEGRLSVPKATSFHLEKVGDAHRAIESWTTIGKQILTP